MLLTGARQGLGPAIRPDAARSLATLGIHIRDSGYVHDSDVDTVSNYSDRLARDKLEGIMSDTLRASDWKLGGLSEL